VIRPSFLAIDPGPAQSGWALMSGADLLGCGVEPNDDLLVRVAGHIGPMAVEMIASYGMAVGREVFETCVWIGRIVQASRSPEDVRLVYRSAVKVHLCRSTKAKDSNIRQAILDRYPRTGGGATPQVGTKARPGPLYGVSSHAWPAIGVALTAQEAPACPT
jgi:hypothetical protein